MFRQWQLMASLFSINPEWSNTLTEEELDFVRCHEGMHRVLRHHLRMNDRDSELWNIATDYAINSILKKSGMTMPKDGLYDAKNMMA